MIRELPEPHFSFLQLAGEVVERDPRFDALLAGGSYVHGGFDGHSDLDLILVVAEESHAATLASRTEFARSLGKLIGAFTGEHVGEPRLLICLYGPPLLHVDLKFIVESDLNRLVERPAVLFARDPQAIEARLATAFIAWPERTAQWFEDRAWIWLHYAATKVMRGELFETIGMLGFFREQVLGPMLHRRANRPQRGIRRIEALGLDPDGRLAVTATRAEAGAIKDAIAGAIALYLDLRTDEPPQHMARDMPSALLDFLQ